MLVVAEPTAQSLPTARRVARLAGARGAAVGVVASTVRGEHDVVRTAAARDREVLAAVPAHGAVRDAERAGLALLDAAPASPAVRAIERLADVLATGRGSAAAAR